MAARAPYLNACTPEPILAPLGPGPLSVAREARGYPVLLTRRRDPTCLQALMLKLQTLSIGRDHEAEQ